MQALSESDRSLVARYRNGDGEAAKALFDRYSQRLHRLAAARMAADLRPRFDPDDVLQSVFRSFFRRVNDGAYHAPETGELWNLLAVMTVHKVRHKAAYHRCAKRSVQQTDSAEPLQGLEASHFVEVDSQIALAEFLAELSDLEREITSLRLEGYSVGEIAAKARRSKRTVERVLQHVRNIVLTSLQDESDPAKLP